MPPPTTGSAAAPGNPEIARGQEQPSETERRREIEQRAKQERTAVSLEELGKRRRYDPESVKLIDEIKPNDNPEKIRQNLDRLFLVSGIILGVALYKSPDIEGKLEDFDFIALLSPAFQKIGPNAPEIAAYRKLVELRNTQGSAVYNHMKAKWGEIVSAAKRMRQEMNDALGETPVTAKIVALIRDNPIPTVLILFIGAVGIYKAVKWIFGAKKEEKKDEEKDKKEEEGKGKKEDKREKSGFWKWAFRIGGAGLFLFGAGRVLGYEGVKKLLKDKLGWNVDGNRVARALTLASHARFKDAWEILWEGVDENAAFHGCMADIISRDVGEDVSGRRLFEIKDRGFKEFMSAGSRAADDFDAKATGQTGQLLMEFDARRRGKEQIAIRKFFEKYSLDGKIAGLQITDKTTVEDVLIAIAGSLGVRETPGGKTAPPPAPTAPRAQEKQTEPTDQEIIAVRDNLLPLMQLQRLSTEFDDIQQRFGSKPEPGYIEAAQLFQRLSESLTKMENALSEIKRKGHIKFGPSFINPRIHDITSAKTQIQERTSGWLAAIGAYVHPHVRLIKDHLAPECVQKLTSIQTLLQDLTDRKLTTASNNPLLDKFLSQQSTASAS